MSTEPVGPTGLQSLPAVERIESLDVLRGFALLGILLMNILGFGLHSAGYFNPLVGAASGPFGHGVDLGLWGLFDVTVEGAMRGLFSMLFGASLLLFTTGSNAKSAAIHYRRQCWLLCFGLLNGYVLLWSGDVLFTYALAGMALYPLRNVRPRSLLIAAAAVGLLLAAVGTVLSYGLGQLRVEADVVAAAPAGQVLPEETIAAAAEWEDFAAGVTPSEQQLAAELATRRQGYLTNFRWNTGVMAETLLFVVPVIMFWDALLMMLIGMALMRLGVMTGTRSRRFYWRLLAGGALVGLTVNGFEVYGRVASGFDALQLFGYFAPSYQLGRLGMALAWLALVMLLCGWATPAAWWQGVQSRLAAVGRVALSNYLLQSLLGMLLFTGAGLGLVGHLSRWQLYVVVLLIWALQLLWTPAWLRHFRFGPVEWVWRWLTYGTRPRLRRQAPDD